MAQTPSALAIKHITQQLDRVRNGLGNRVVLLPLGENQGVADFKHGK
jgi:hypothetical protein